MMGAHRDDAIAYCPDHAYRVTVLERCRAGILVALLVGPLGLAAALGLSAPGAVITVATIFTSLAATSAVMVAHVGAQLGATTRACPACRAVRRLALPVSSGVTPPSA